MLQATFMYELHHQTVASTTAHPMLSKMVHSERHLLMFQMGERSRVVMSRLKRATLPDAVLPTAREGLHQAEHQQILSWTYSWGRHNLFEDVIGPAVNTCLWTVEMLQKAIKRSGQVASFQHWGPQSGCIAGVRRGAMPALSSAVTSACLRVAALEFPSINWGTVEYDANKVQVQSPYATMLMLMDRCNLFFRCQLGPVSRSTWNCLPHQYKK